MDIDIKNIKWCTDIVFYELDRLHSWGRYFGNLQTIIRLSQLFSQFLIYI